mmetsp:Transcript_9641/g.13479  ORF Transcript_9641/g.13479 Transcript_9641/m.13479 type:complete len:648 (-) Transcript_9641:136-2079(-)
MTSKGETLNDASNMTLEKPTQPTTKINQNNDDGNHNGGSTCRPGGRYRLLIEFAHKHLDFHRPELHSVLGMHGITLDNNDSDAEHNDNGNTIGCKVEELPNEGQFIGDSTKSCIRTMPRRPFLILSFPLSAIGTKFRLDEEEDRLNIHNQSKEDAAKKKSTSTTATNDNNNNQLPTIASILSRCTLVRSVVELWGIGTTIENCANDAKSLFMSSSSSSTSATTQNTKAEREIILTRNSQPNQSWKMTVHTLGCRYTRDEQNEMRRKFAFLEFPGPVKMDHPTNEYIIIREIELDQMGSPVYPRHGLNKEIIPDNDARPPLAVYFGRILGGARNWRGGKMEPYSLKKRAYLGPTSMDSELSLIMTNLAQVKRSSFCFDPFVGTGSILLTCALRGAHCFGTDIDIRVLRGRGSDENIISNFRQYGLPRPDLVRSDNAIYTRHYRKHEPLYDAIVTDPPYGIRAGARKSGSKLDDPRPVLEEHRYDHIAQTRPYAVSDVMSDLLDVAARTLVLGGRLCYVIPSMTDFDVQTDLPRHECLKLVHVCYQPLQLELGRRIVAMEKVAEYDDSRRDEYLSNVWVNGPESADKVAKIRERLMEAAKKKPGYEEKAAARKQKRKATKEAKKRAKREATAASTTDRTGGDVEMKDQP